MKYEEALIYLSRAIKSKECKMDDAFIEALDTACDAMISILEEPLTRWIPVSERLPEIGVTVLGTFKFQGGNDCLTTERLIIHGEERWAAGMGMTPIAWMPLPEPYNDNKL